MTENENKNKKQIDKLENDIIKCYFKYGSTPKEFFVFGFRYHDSKRRSEFLTNQHKDKIMIRRLGMGENWDMLEDKFLFYKRFKDFFHRDVCVVREEDDKTDFLSFVQRHKNFIVKPIDGQYGKGIKIKNTDGSKETALDIFYCLLSKGSYIIEELIIQDKKLAEWNPESVNTIRLTTFLNNEGFHVFKPFFRVGLNSSIVDGSALYSVIDEESGILLTDGYNGNGDSFKKHPDSKIVFKDWQIPKWKELIYLAERIHKVIPHQPYIGWDFALTDNGWVLIEGNWGQFLSEWADKEGIKEKFESFFD